MARSATKKSTLTSAPPALQRQAKRLTRQQKRLEQELMAAAPLTTTSATTRSRGITFRELKTVNPMTRAQEDFFDAWEAKDAIAAVGSAGSGKSYIALALALADVLSGETPYKRIVILRSIAAVREMGYLKGDIDEKSAPFEAPYQDICSALLGRKDAYDKLKDMGVVEFATTSHTRGLTFNNAIIILDEVQNCTFSEISTVITRTGKDSKLVVIGDGAQTDISKSKTDMSGFQDMMRVISNMREFGIIKFTIDDIVRSGLCKSWLIATEKLGLF